MFFDDHPEFQDTSTTANKVGRLNVRHLAIIEQNQDVLRGARVLDIASHDGRWSFAALEAGAAHVTGVEGRDYLVENAYTTFAAKGLDESRFKFIVGDVHDVMTAGVGEFDVVMCLGFLYHTLRYNELFSGIRKTRAKHLIIDTAVVAAPRGLVKLVNSRVIVRLGNNPVQRESAAVADRFSYGKRTMVGRPSTAAVNYMLDSYGYDLVKQTAWPALLKQNRDAASELKAYKKGERVTLLARRRGK